MHFLFIFRSFIMIRKAVISTMYKKLHNEETRSHPEPFSQEGSFLSCVPERDIMLTTFVYHIQPKNRKNYLLSWVGSFFYYTYIIKGRMPFGILSSLLKFLNVIHIDNSPKNKSMNIMWFVFLESSVFLRKHLLNSIVSI